MKTQTIVLVTGFALALTSPAFAQGKDVAYCQALAAKYQTYAGQGSGGRHGGADNQDIDARRAIEKCNSGDTSGVPVLEQALTNAKIALPPHG
ncbi:MAG: hypothetical protein JSR47_12010 [Proteobacteria bacterium]|nr:hypothetical protein [Pseudomonadota bacterium]MBS0546470.1 hypothetical protein [Pseudomonadota bacterium]